MRLHRCVPVLAAVVGLAGASAPVAYGSEAIAPGGGVPAPTTVVQHHSGGSMDWLIGVGGAAGIVALGTGTAATLRNRRLTVAGSAETRSAS